MLTGPAQLLIVQEEDGQTVVIDIPPEAAFPKMAVDPITGDIEIETAPITIIVSANPAMGPVLQNQHNIVRLVIAWYSALRATGFRDLVMEQLDAELGDEDVFQSFQAQPSQDGMH